MSKYRLFPLLFVGCCAAAFAQDAPPVDTQAMLASLKALQEKHAVSVKEQVAKVLRDFKTASASNAAAIAFYEEATRATSFVGQNREQTQFQEWKRKEAEKLKSREMQTAVRLHVAYAELTLEYATGTPVEQLLPALINYTAQVLAAKDEIGGQEMMKRPVTDSLFVRWYNIGKLFANLKEWEPSPVNVDGIYQKTILPELRKQKDARAVQYWDDRLQREAAEVSETKLSFNIDTFNQVKKPGLLWSRAQEMLKIGQRNRALGEMFALVKNFPDHPDNAQWIAKLEAALAPQ